ncbi:MAG: ABC transporter permease [Chloroflexota bacterium]|nr:ABC transporter permease [Chloroflexota bacterium]
MLYRKLLRDVRRQWAQVAAIGLVVFLSITLFVGPYLAYEDLRDSYRDVQTRTHLADLTLDVTSVSASQVEQIAGLTGVQAAANQLNVDLPATVPAGSAGRDGAGEGVPVRATARLIGIPLGRQPALNEVVVLSGHYPTAATDVLVERHFAEYHHLKAGEAVEVETPAGRQRFAVAGVAVSAEYLWVTRSRQDVFPSPAEFGVLFVPREGLARLGRDALQRLAVSPEGSASPQLAALQLAARRDEGNRLLLSLEPGADAGAVTGEVTSLLGRERVLAATPRAKLPSIQLLQLDVDGFQEMAVALPFFFLAVGGFMIASLLNRQIDQERQIIGTILALGFKRRSLLTHYGGLGLLVGLAGTLPGLVAGMLLGGGMAGEYAAELYIPFVSTHGDWRIVLVAAVIGLGIPVLAAILPARRAAAMEPAEAMRGLRPAQAPAGRIGAIGRARLAGIPLWLRFPLRNVARHPMRALGTAAGVAAAVVLIVTTAGMFDSMGRGLDLAFHQSQRYDLRVDYYLPRPADRVQDALRSVSGVETVETFLALPIRVDNPTNGRTYETVLQGLPTPSPLLRVLNRGGQAIDPKPNGAVVSRSIAEKIAARPGAAVRVTLLPAGPSTTVTIDRLSDSALGNSVTLSAAHAEAAFGLMGKATAALLTVAPGQRAAVRSQLGHLEGVAQVSDLAQMRSQMDELLALGNVFLTMMVLFGVVLAATILFNTATMSIIERRHELATLRAMGERMSGIVRLVTVEHGVIAALGLVLGFPLALASLWGFLQLVSSDLFSMPFWVSGRTVGIALIGTVLVLLFAQWPALRSVSRADLAEAVKSRE